MLTVEIGPRTPSRGTSLARAAHYIRTEFEGAGLDVVEQPYRYENQLVANLIATWAGMAPSSAYYVVGAHYDTVPSTPGADDNASAVAVLLELGRRIAETKLRAPVRLVAFTLEEPPAFMTGKQGSRVFVQAAREARERVAGALVLEMVGYTSARQAYPAMLSRIGYPSEGRFIGIVGNRRSRQLGHTVLTGFRRNSRLPVEHLFVPLNGWILPATRLSDHASFWDVGWPALMITDTAFFRNPHYHLPSDTIETLDFDFMAELVRSLELALIELAPP